MTKEQESKKKTFWQGVKDFFSLRWVQIVSVLGVVAAAIGIFFAKLLGRDTRPEREAKNEVEAAERDFQIEQKHDKEVEQIDEEQKKQEEDLRKEVMRRLRRIKKGSEAKKKRGEDIIMNGSREDVEKYLREELEKGKDE